MFETVDLYCERLGPDFWAEPLNALSNASFLVAAWFAWSRAKHLGLLSPGVWFLLALTCTIGLGSASFHTFANNLTRFLDVLPILIFQLAFVALYCRAIIRIGPITTGAIVAAYLAATLIAREFPNVLNGSLSYAPAFFVLFVVGIYHDVTRRNEPIVILGAATVFVSSLIFRTIDNVVCPHFSLGTHFLWHLFNGLVLYLLLRALLANHPDGPDASETMRRSDKIGGS